MFPRQPLDSDPPGKQGHYTGQRSTEANLFAERGNDYCILTIILAGCFFKGSVDV